MSDRARERLGPAENVLDGFPADVVPLARSLLSGDASVIEACTETYRRAGSADLVPVCFSRLFALEDRVWLGAQVAEPGTEAALREIRGWRNVQENVLRHYFQLQGIQEKLQRSRRSRSGRGRTAIRLLEEERARLGRDLHAGVGQSLAAVRVHLEGIREYAPQLPEAVRESLDRIGTLAEDALQQVRSVARGLHPPEWERLELHEALRQLWDISGIPRKYEAVQELQPLPGEPVREKKVLIYRTAQEAISNWIRHAQASRVRMSLQQRGEFIVFIMEDNGKGFDAEKLRAAAAGVGSGIGLRSIRDQAAGLAGNFQVESGPSGTKLILSLPLDTSHLEDDECPN